MSWLFSACLCTRICFLPCWKSIYVKSICFLSVLKSNTSQRHMRTRVFRLFDWLFALGLVIEIGFPCITKDSRLCSVIARLSLTSETIGLDWLFVIVIHLVLILLLKLDFPDYGGKERRWTVHVTKHCCLDMKCPHVFYVLMGYRSQSKPSWGAVGFINNSMIVWYRAVRCCCCFWLDYWYFVFAVWIVFWLDDVWYYFWLDDIRFIIIGLWMGFLLYRLWVYMGFQHSIPIYTNHVLYQQHQAGSMNYHTVPQRLIFLLYGYWLLWYFWLADRPAGFGFIMAGWSMDVCSAG